MMRSVLLLSAIAAYAMATESTASPLAGNTQQKCKTAIERADKQGSLYPKNLFGEGNENGCLSYVDYQSQFCNECERLRKVSERYVNGMCCPTYECVRRDDNPCCGVTCKANTYEEAEEKCNVIYENNQVWNELSVYFGAMVAVKVETADPARGKCCDKYQCETNNAVLCENEIERTPCVTEATCPACYYAEQSEPTNIAEHKCCASIVCVRDNTCMCNNRDNQECPMPTCNEFEQLVVLAEATADSCCAVYTCQRNLAKICAAKQEIAVFNVFDNEGQIVEQTGFTDETPSRVCGPCQTVQKFKPANFAAGRCFPEWKCVPVADKCCENSFYVGQGILDLDGNSCDDYKPDCSADDCATAIVVRPMNEIKGRCCDTWACAVDNVCACNKINCPFETAVQYQAYFCPNRPGDKVAQLKEVVTIPAVPEAGKCCPTFSCRDTAAKKVKDVRLAKRKAKRASRAAAKAAAASTTASPATTRK